MDQKYECLRLDNQLCFPLYAASRKIVQKYTPYLKELDLTYTQYITLMVLWEEGETTVKELTRRLFLDTGTMTPLLHKMEKNGLVTRCRSKEDERVVKIALTDKGWALRDRAAEIPPKIGACVNLSPEEGYQMYQLLYKLLANEC